MQIFICENPDCQYCNNRPIETNRRKRYCCHDASKMHYYKLYNKSSKNPKPPTKNPRSKYFIEQIYINNGIKILPFID
jgi:hypothetical protein